MKETPIIKTMVAFLMAPMVAGFCAGLLALLADPTHPYDLFFAIGYIGSFIAVSAKAYYLATLVIWFPIDWLLVKKHWTRLAHYALAGIIFGWLSLFLPSLIFFFFNFTIVTSAELKSVFMNMYNYWESGFWGIITAITFWFLARPDKDAGSAPIDTKSMP